MLILLKLLQRTAWDATVKIKSFRIKVAVKLPHVLILAHLRELAMKFGFSAIWSSRFIELPANCNPTDDKHMLQTKKPQ